MEHQLQAPRTCRPPRSPWLWLRSSSRVIQREKYIRGDIAPQPGSRPRHGCEGPLGVLGSTSCEEPGSLPATRPVPPGRPSEPSEKENPALRTADSLPPSSEGTRAKKPGFFQLKGELAAFSREREEWLQDCPPGAAAQGAGRTVAWTWEAPVPPSVSRGSSAPTVKWASCLRHELHGLVQLQHPKR